MASAGRGFAPQLADTLQDLAASEEHLDSEPDRPGGPTGGPFGVAKGLGFEAEAEPPDPKHLANPSTHRNEPALATAGLPVCGDDRRRDEEPAPIITANWNAASGNKWTVPVGGGVGKIFRWGKAPPMNVNIQGYYNAVKPDGIGRGVLRLQFQLMFPKKG